MHRCSINGLIAILSLDNYTSMAKPQSSPDDDDDSIWVVYEAPPDFPDQYVARRLHLNQMTPDYVVGDTLIEVRSKLPKGLFKIERSERDDPMIRESWI